MDTRLSRQKILVLLSTLGLLFFTFVTQAAAPLKPEQAFAAQASWLDDTQIVITMEIADGYYLYQHSVQVFDDQETALPLLQQPAGQPYHDEFLGDVVISRGSVEWLVGYDTPPATQPQQLRLVSQGCADIGICYPPYDQPLVIRQAGALFTPPSAVAPLFNLFADPEPALPQAVAPQPTPNNIAAAPSEQEQINQLLQQGHWWLVITTFFILGVGLSLTPCVLPMVPILASLIAGQQQSSRRSSVMLSVVYVLSMATTYALIGAAAAWFGANLQVTLQHPGFILLMAAIFIALALGMFGWYQLQLPQGIQTLLQGWSHKLNGGHYLGVWLMGMLATLILTPCVTPALAGALLYITQQDAVALGALALFCMGLGMGLPLLAVGAFGATALPKSGPWMEAIKQGFGVVLLGMAIWSLSPLVDPSITLGLWAVLAIISGCALGALQLNAATGWPRVWQGLGLSLVIAGGLLLAQALSPSPPKTASAPSSSTAIAQTETLSDGQQLSARLAQAQRQGQPVVLDFYADWCKACQVMEQQVIATPEVQAALGPALLLKLDMTQFDASHQQLLDQYQLFGPPAYLFFDASGQERTALRLVGESTLADFVSRIQDIQPSS